MPIVIAGAFRNGTTLTAKLLHDVIGCYGGKLGGELQPQNLEHRKIRKLSNHLISYYGGHWIKPDGLEKFCNSFHPNEHHKQLGFWYYLANREIENLAKKADGMEYFWKDTRLPITLPAWHQVVDNPKYIVPYRQPSEAIKSMQRLAGKNYGFEHVTSYHSALYVWDTYYSRLLDYLSAHPEIPVMGVDYEEWMFDFDRLHMRLTIFLQCKINKDKMAELFKPTHSYEQDGDESEHPTYTRLKGVFG